VALLFVLSLGVGIAEPPLEAPLPPGAVALDESGRYRSPRSFDETLDFYQRLFNQGGVRWRSIVNLPGIRAKHIECLRKKTHWEGINIYEYKGEVRLFVVPREAKPKAVQRRP
jgi:hypothetical protein